jgi:hypothetical protein
MDLTYNRTNKPLYSGEYAVEPNDVKQLTPGGPIMLTEDIVQPEFSMQRDRQSDRMPTGMTRPIHHAATR